MRRQLYEFKWLLIWALIYSFLLWLLGIIVPALSNKFAVLQGQIAHLLLIGLGMAVFSRILYAAIHKQIFSLNLDLLYWAGIYAFLFWLFNFLLSKAITDFGIVSLKNEYLNLLMFGLSFSLVIKFLRRARFGQSISLPHLSEIPWWVLIIIFILGFVALNQIYLPYATRPLNDINLKCENGKLMLKDTGFGGLLSEIQTGISEVQAGFTCIEYKSSRCRRMCQNEQPVCQCEAVLWDRIFKREGEWILE